MDIEHKILTKPLSPLQTFGLGKERLYLIENLSALVSAGVSVMSALDSIAKELRSKQMKLVVSSVLADLENGQSLWFSLERTGVFKKSDIALLRIGEETGQLSKNMEVVAMQNRKDRLFKSKIKSAMLYPVLVLSITVIVSLGTAWFILPKLATVFAQMRLDLPLLTDIVIKIGLFLGDYGIYAVPAIIVLLIITVIVLFFWKKTRHIGQWLLFHTPGVGRLMKEVEIARFGYLLGLLLRSGVPVLQSLESFATTAQLRPYRDFYFKLRDSVKAGNSFQKSFHDAPESRKLIPTPIQQMVIAGEQSGQLSDMLQRISDIYEAKADATTKNLTVILEPVLLIFVWIGVLLLALSVIMPIYGLLEGLR